MIKINCSLTTFYLFFSVWTFENVNPFRLAVELFFLIMSFTCVVEIIKKKILALRITVGSESGTYRGFFVHRHSFMVIYALYGIRNLKKNYNSNCKFNLVKNLKKNTFV